MKSISIQIQSVIYNNDKEDLFKTVSCISKAVEYSRLYGDLSVDLVLIYGDASVKQIFSSDEIEELRNKYKKTIDINYKFFNENTGSAKGHNILAKNCKCDYIMILNPDILIAPNLFMEITKPFFDTSLKCGIAEARQTPIEHPKAYNEKTGETSWAATACALIPTTVFNEVNGFDSDTFFLYCDDVDFSWKVRLAGYKVIYQPTAFVYHAKRLSNMGNWTPTSSEVYYSSEAALLLSYKWSNSKLTNKLLNDFKNSSDENLKKAYLSFEKRKAENRLPVQVDQDHKVAEFVNGNYAKHKFVL